MRGGPGPGGGGGRVLSGDLAKMLLVVSTVLGDQLPKCCRLGEVLERGGCVLAGADERPLKVFFKHDIKFKLKVKVFSNTTHYMKWGDHEMLSLSRI